LLTAEFKETLSIDLAMPEKMSLLNEDSNYNALFYFAGKRICFHIYDVIVKQKK
jgi:hypothetical protein